MIKNILKAPVKFSLILDKSKYKFSNELQQEINEFWKEKLKINNNLYNGLMFNITYIESIDDEYKIHLNESNYAHYLFSEKDRMRKDICRSIAVSAIIKTRDNYYVLGKMGKKTAYPGIIQCPSGSIDKELEEIIFIHNTTSNINDFIKDKSIHKVDYIDNLLKVNSGIDNCVEFSIDHVRQRIYNKI